MKPVLSGTKPHNFYLFIALFWGSMLVFINPPFNVPDEPAHFFRSYQVAEFQFIPEIENNRLGGYLPSSLGKFSRLSKNIRNDSVDKGVLIKDLTTIDLAKEKELFFFFPNTSLYSPVSYIPQSMGIIIGKIFNSSPAYLFYLGRLFNLMLWITLVYFALKLIPVYKWLFVTLALLPMSISQAASMSADAITNGLSFLLIALILKFAIEDKTVLDRKYILLIITVVVLLSLSKTIYFLMAFLFLLIPITKWKNSRSYYKTAISLGLFIIVALVSNALIVKYLTAQVVPITEIYGSGNLSPRINPDEQIQFIFSDPLNFLGLVFNSIYFHFQTIVITYIGVLGWLDIRFPIFYYLSAILVILVLSVFDNSTDIKIYPKQKLIMLGVFLSILMLFMFTMYLSWNNVGDMRIDNLQGRYFIPVVPVLLIVFYNNKYRVDGRLMPFISMLFTSLSFVLTSYFILNRFYL